MQGRGNGANGLEGREDLHQLCLVIELVRDMEEKPILKPARRPGECGLLSFLVHTQEEEAAGLVGVRQRIKIRLLELLLAAFERFLVVP